MDGARLSEPAQRVLELAREEARASGHALLGTEHLLLALAREEHAGIAAHLLRSLGLDVSSLRAAVRAAAHPPVAEPPQQAAPTPRAQAVFELAGEVCARSGEPAIGTEHLLLAVVADEQALAVRLLRDAGVTPADVRRRVHAATGHPRVVRLHSGPRAARRQGLRWHAAQLIHRRDGVELRVPLDFAVGSLATFAADAAFSRAPLLGLRRELWEGWLALASLTLLEQTDAAQLRRTLDGAAQRTIARSGRDDGAVSDFTYLCSREGSSR